MNYDKSQNETENLSADEQKLREMCRSLKKTDAPPDFDFKLKARIASAQPSDFKPRFGFAFRYALPALAVILILGILALSGAFFPSGNNPSVADVSVAPQNPATPPPNTTASTVAAPEISNQNSAVLLTNQNLPKPSEVAISSKPPKSREVRKTGGVRDFRLLNSSKDEALTGVTVLRPRGFDQKTVPQNLQNTEQTNQLPVKEILSVIGVSADLENGKWKVKSVRANSIGESSDIKENDVIEAIDNQPLSPETVFTKTVKGNSVTVTRGGEKLQLKLRGRQ